MKFTSLGERREKCCRIKSLDGGVNFSAAPHNIADNELSSAENVEFADGVLKTRAGLSADEYDIIKNETDSYAEDIGYTVTGATAFINGRNKRIAYEQTYDGDSNYVYSVLLLDADGSASAIGQISFSRVSDDTFYTPYSILFYGGAPIKGGGIFALVTARNEYNHSEYSYKVYEVNKAMTAWLPVTDFYEPVVMINGRGNNYETAKSTNLAYTASPKLLEARNILTTRFKAYFTSDGCSTSFRLPYSGLANESVTCRIYTSLTDYTEWVIMPDAVSDTQTFYTAKITMRVDRSKGIVYFTGADNKDYPVPVMSMYHENNICVRAGKSAANEELREICTLTCCAVYDSKLIFSGGSENGKIYSVAYSNPLYFSEKNTSIIGETGSGINALLPTKNGILAFKENAVYKMKLNSGNALNTGSLLADDDSVFYDSDTFSQAKQADIGCVNSRVCVLCGSYPVWLSGDRKIYTVNSATGKVTELSKQAEKLLDSIGSSEIKTAAAFGESGKYWLMLGGRVLIMHFNSEKGSRQYYVRRYEKCRPIDMIASGANRRYICVGSDGRVLYYAADGALNADTDITGGASGTVISSVPYSSRFTAKSFDFGTLTHKKHIESISLTAACGGRLKIRLSGGGEEEISVDLTDSSYCAAELNVLRIIPHIGAVRALGLEFEADCGMEIGEISINYREA